MLRLLFAVAALVQGLAGAPIHDAARQGNIALLRALLQSGVNPNLPGDRGRTPLHEAVTAAQFEAIELLLGTGADPVKPDQDRRTPLSDASANPDLNTRARLMSMLLATRPGRGPRETDPWTLQSAAAHGQLPVVEMLLKLNVDVNAVGSNGNRALDIACLKGNLEIVRALISHGANVNLTNSAGSTPLHDAALSGKAAVGELLLERRARIDAQDTENQATPLYVAVSFSHPEFARMLIEHGAKTDLKTKSGKTALDAARESGLKDIVELLSRK